jgi:2-polyprenyl-3-methyl-5-hydroxy-6-metoxy-1,4-benzoquinol methylase
MTQNLEYKYSDAGLNHSHDYLMPALIRQLNVYRPKRIFDLGCGNGSVAHILSTHSKVDGIDISESAIAEGNTAYPGLNLKKRSVYEDLAADYGAYPMVISLEVVEHLYDPRNYTRNLFKLVEPGGIAILSTPYHGYLKNCALALSGKLDSHFTALWDGGHVKFWSVRTLRFLLEEAGFEFVTAKRVGRIPIFAKSMMLVVRRPL